MDPSTARDVLVNAAGGIISASAVAGTALAVRRGAELRQRLGAALGELLQRVLPQAREQMTANADAFIGRLAGELAGRETQDVRGDTLGSLPLEEAFADPARAYVLEKGLLAASLTSSERRHAVIASAVATQLGVEVDSSRAAESAAAVESVARLGGGHLRILGLLALVHHVARLSPLPVPTEIVQGVHSAQLELMEGLPAIRYEDAYQRALDALRPLARELAAAHTQRFARWCESHEIAGPPKRSDVFHLRSEGCVVAEAHEHELHQAILAPDPNPVQGSDTLFSTLQSWIASGVAEQLAETEHGARLRKVWYAGLANLALTPAGLLIGLAVHDTVTGEHRAREWEWAPDDRPAWTAWPR